MPASVKPGPERRCIVSGETLHPDALIRFALSPAGEVAPDFSGKLPGRGAWVRLSRQAVETAVAKKLFARAFKAQISAPADLPDVVERGFEKAGLSAIGLARRAGDLVLGFEKVRDALKAGKAAVLLTASDASEGGRGKLGAVGDDITRVVLFDRAALSAALGGGDVVHAAIRPGAAAGRVERAAARLTAYRGDSADRM